jgi:hypothetical protein
MFCNMDEEVFSDFEQEARVPYFIKRLCDV